MKTILAQIQIRVILASLILVFLLTCCQTTTFQPSVSSITPSTFHETPRINPIILKPTGLPSTPTLTYPTPTSTEHVVEIKHISSPPQELEIWGVSYFYSEPKTLDLLLEGENDYYLDPFFEVTNIALSYKWIGMSGEKLKFLNIHLAGAGSWQGDAQISAEQVASFIQSISHLHPQPNEIECVTHFDDYPSWIVELSDNNTNTILLYSTSNSSNRAPWNVIYNGEIFTQFDGQIYNALYELFGLEENKPRQSDWGEKPGYMKIDTFISSPQLRLGFSGLLPVNQDFHYTPDPERSEMRGYLNSQTQVRNLGNGVSASINDLREIEVMVHGNEWVECSLEKDEIHSDQETVHWDFVCFVGKPEADLPYQLPIHMTFLTTDAQLFALSGQLFG